MQEPRKSFIPQCSLVQQEVNKKIAVESYYICICVYTYVYICVYVYTHTLIIQVINTLHSKIT